MDFSDKLIIGRPVYISDGADPKCGYCHGKKDVNDRFATQGWRSLHQKDEDKIELQSTTMGFHSELINAEMYDKLCNLGFRRSGSFIYKTDMLRNCCRLYTIRTNKDYLTMTKELKTTLKRFKKKITSTKFKPQGNHGDWVDQLCDYESQSESFKTVFEPAKFTKAKYDLYVKYQGYIHSDEENTPQQFESFLCDSPFPESEKVGTDGEWEQLNNWHNLQPGEVLKKNGSAHECYYDDGKLIAISVLDFMPTGVSSVYFIWDPDYHSWSLGKVSALRELALVSKIGRPYYYLGYFIQDCPKMNYKAKFGGEILDVHNKRYLPLKIAEQHVEHNGFFVASDNVPETKDGGPNDLTKSCGYSFDNVVDEIYGPNGSAFSKVNCSVKKLRNHKLCYLPDPHHDVYNRAPGENNIVERTGTKHVVSSLSTDQEDLPELSKIHRIPNVVPGLVSLEDIVTLIDNGKLDQLNGQLIIFDTSFNGLRMLIDFDSEEPIVKTTISDITRLIGLENVKKSIIII
ncbi:unnamed protein product [Kluyveromyces dobzhanskii CBS 2104]|uniref:arginyltransferase n=1 Tax=Kluyveromyces dobzhanskii CBS 2104 TaxID=1427455 RepID=A0A0A8LD58_9SACH|nr:unnamed protein product [Kluyveromyces dobzhanskii CBS 2104]